MAEPLTYELFRTARHQALAGRCLTAFDALWERATPHENYQPT